MAHDEKTKQHTAPRKRRRAGDSGVSRPKAPGSPTPGADKEEHGGISWIKTAGGAVGVIAAIIGVFATVYTMIGQSREFNLKLEQQRSEWAKEIARQNVLAEEEKTKQAGLSESEKTKQIQAETEKQRLLAEQAGTLRDKAQSEREAADLALRQEEAKNRAHEIENDAAERRAAREYARQDQVDADARQRDTVRDVTTLITKALTDTPDNEGTLAQLSRYLNSGSENTQPIQVALEAKLAQVKSPGEVRVIFRLLRQLGTPSLEFVADANRNARAEFDRLWLIDIKRRYCERLRDTGELIDGTAERTLLDVLNYMFNVAERDYKIPADYLGATALNGHNPGEVLGLPLGISPAEAKVFLTDKDRIGALRDESRRIGIEGQIILESRAALRYLLSHPPADGVRDLDLSSCYLGGMRWGHIPYSNARFDRAYVGGAQFSMTAYTPDALETLLGSAVGVGPSYYGHRFIPARDDRSIKLY